ncbi:DEAD/DEAH box helicase family protein [Serratia fonticola]|uniref:DEAD/DEAH box helicase family protein n=1 Tax=Serratia fonticola TaxID=47917 RepID=UPI00192B337E|nr:DEAD/DEAH box helicase family protein [Serratia fonticola]MBL5903081.1 DEAD/DEAH box helicase family protein [Serratia fonticola]
MTIYNNLKLKATYFENRYSSDNKVVKDKAAKEGRKVGETRHVDEAWGPFINLVMDRNGWPTFSAHNEVEYNNAKKKFDAVVFVEMKKGSARSHANVIAHYAVVLDIDDGISMDEVRSDLNDYEHLIYSSGGQGIKQGERFRVILPLKRPISADVYNEFSESLRKRFWYSDASFSKTLQIQYLPTYNKVFEDQFKAYHNSGRLFDLECIDYVPVVNQDVFINVDFTKPKFDNDELGRILDAIVDHNRGTMEYEQRRILANRLSAFGVNHFDMVQVLEAVGKPGANNTGSDMAAKANASYGHAMGLRKNLPDGFKFNLLVQPTVIYTPKNVKLPKYDTDVTLKPNQYLSDVIKQVTFKDGFNLLIADVGTGKNHYFSKLKKTKLVVPLSSIVEQAGSNNKLEDNNVATWNQIITMMKKPEECKQWDLVIDEAHGMISDYGYKSKTISILIEACSMFRRVILMSGTVRPEYFNGFDFETIHRVRKPSTEKKQIQTYICKSKEESLLNDLREIKNKAIVLMNDKDLGKTIGERSRKNYMLVNADLKNEPEVLNLYRTGVMGDYDCIIGTNSIVEGLSIHDNHDEIDVFIWGDTDPDRIEQVTNRFRNIKNVRNVRYYVDSKPCVGKIEDNVKLRIELAQNLAEANTRYLSVLLTDEARNSHIRQYRDESLQAAVYYDDGEFRVNYSTIDYDSQLVRQHNAFNDFGIFSNRLIEYGYDVFYPIWRNERTAEKEQIEKDVKEVKANREQQRYADLMQLAYDFESDSLASDYSLEYNGIKDVILNMLDGGLKKQDVGSVIGGIIKQSDYIQKVWTDIKHVDTGNSIREFVSKEVKKSLVHTKEKYYLFSQDAIRIAQLVTDKVLTEFYQGDLDAMLANENWASDIQKVPNGGSNSFNIIDDPLGTFEVKGKRASAIINRYICLGGSVKRQCKGERNRAFEVLHYSLTGLEFDRRSEDQKLADAVAARKIGIHK